jgi:hypothetical protein
VRKKAGSRKLHFGSAQFSEWMFRRVSDCAPARHHHHCERSGQFPGTEAWIASSLSSFAVRVRFLNACSGVKNITRREMLREKRSIAHR